MPKGDGENAVDIQTQRGKDDDQKAEGEDVRDPQREAEDHGQDAEPMARAQVSMRTIPIISRCRVI
jgi:hypothetical protein